VELLCEIVVVVLQFVGACDDHVLNSIRLYEVHNVMKQYSAHLPLCMWQHCLFIDIS